MLERKTIQSTTPIGLARYAFEYYISAKIVANSSDFKSYDPKPSVAYYLIGHSIELALKSFLLQSGVSLDKLRNNYGHDLEQLICASCKNGIQTYFEISSSDIFSLQLLNELYCKKEFEYTSTGFKTLLAYQSAENLSHTIVHGVAQLVGYPIR